MHCRTHLVALAYILIIGLVVGCAGDSTFNLSPDESSRSASSGNNRTSRPAAVASSRPSSGASPTESIGRVFRQVGTSVSQAWHDTSGAEPMGDPARLDSPPEQLTSALYVRAAAWSEHQGATAKARQQYEKALELEPRNVKTILLLARFHDRQKNDSEASRWYARARELEPNNAVVLNDIGLFHARRREFQPALEALEQAVRLTPRNVRYHNNLAGVLVQAGRPNDAVTSLQRVHGDTIANLNVGNFLYMEKDFSRAALYLRRAQQLDPSLVAARDLLSRIDEAVAQVAPATDERTRIVTARSEAGGYSSPYRPVSTPTAGSLETRSWNGTRLPLIADRAPSTTANEGPRRLPVPQ